jgi:carbon monoxide dehydrogenase subunit G
MMPTHPVVPPKWIGTAPILVTESIDIAASPAKVWGFVQDHEAWGSWFEALDKIEVTGARTGVGGARRVTAGRVVIDEHFTAWIENEHFAFAVTKSPIPFLQTLAEEVCLEPSEKGCRVTYRQGLQAKKGFEWLLKRAWKKPAKELADALRNLQRLAEL